MKGDDNNASSRTHNTHRGIEKFLETVQFVVHINSESLECSRRRMNLTAPWTAGHSYDGMREIRRHAHGPRAHNRSRNRTGAPLFAKFIEDVGNILFGVGIDYFGSRQGIIAIHSHIDRAFTHK